MEALNNRDVVSDYQILGPWALIDVEGEEYKSSIMEIDEVPDKEGRVIPNTRRLLVGFKVYKGQDTKLTLIARLKPTFLKPSDNGHISMMDVHFNDIPMNTDLPHNNSTGGFSVSVETEKVEESKLIVETRLKANQKLINSLLEEIGFEIRDNLNNKYSTNVVSTKRSDDIVIREYSFSDIL